MEARLSDTAPEKPDPPDRHSVLGENLPHDPQAFRLEIQDGLPLTLQRPSNRKDLSRRQLGVDQESSLEEPSMENP
jgi:hypothetical protein